MFSPLFSFLSLNIFWSKAQTFSFPDLLYFTGKLRLVTITDPVSRSLSLRISSKVGLFHFFLCFIFIYFLSPRENNRDKESC